MRMATEHGLYDPEAAAALTEKMERTSLESIGAFYSKMLEGEAPNHSLRKAADSLTTGDLKGLIELRDDLSGRLNHREEYQQKYKEPYRGSFEGDDLLSIDAMRTFLSGEIQKAQSKVQTEKTGMTEEEIQKSREKIRKMDIR